MILLLLAIGFGVATQVPRLRAHYARSAPGQVWDHFLVSADLRPVPASMADVVTVATRADVPASMLDRAALGRSDDGELLLVATLVNGRVLIGVRRTGLRPATPGLLVVDGWHLQVLDGPPAVAWEATPLRRSPAPTTGSRDG